jgi:hypothetical protein
MRDALVTSLDYVPRCLTRAAIQIEADGITFIIAPLRSQIHHGNRCAV